LLIHEFLHVLQVRKGVESAVFYAAVARWYRDPDYGMPSPDGLDPDAVTRPGMQGALAINRMKYILWFQLYNSRKLSKVPGNQGWKDMNYVERYQSSEKGVEEFAYIGEEILASGSSSEHYLKTGQWDDQDWKSKKMRLSEISPELIAFYKGLFNPALKL